ncbi:hypothetical protein GYMLUDRAFT_49945 [Collybiopsis luxurians FD-317 M1]|uniref:Uncharacterized protein n=1 Tax=Collybiopsis luxurians FD-317 M1 TaxID=944289 RepID=A0A0D0BS61_9AGAR|nr:hypothetical protein GYMLUDRAFT_49945 [Collybiopsis luxurians FD-317 M1]
MGDKPQAVIVMIKQPGEILDDNAEYKAASKQEKEEMKKQAINLMCEEAWEDIKLGMYHFDNQAGNTVVVVKGKKVESAKIVDYGGDYVFHVREGVKKEVVIAFCQKEAAQFWDEFREP